LELTIWNQLNESSKSVQREHGTKALIVNITYLNGARLGTPSDDKDETNAIGRGTIPLVINMYIVLVTIMRMLWTTQIDPHLQLIRLCRIVDGEALLFVLFPLLGCIRVAQSITRPPGGIRALGPIKSWVIKWWECWLVRVGTRHDLLDDKELAPLITFISSILYPESDGQWSRDLSHMPTSDLSTRATSARYS